MVSQPYSGFRRIPCSEKCVVHVRGLSFEGRLCNISVLGVYLSSNPVPNIGEALRLSFTLPGDSNPIHAEADVTWRNPSENQRVFNLPTGCGVRFLKMEPPDRERLEAFVSSYAGPRRPR